jgi:uncharacterized protein YeaO (DUF488 family)
VQIKRVYEDPSPSDGYRLLVDRVWPRGVSKERAQIDDWARDLAPSSELRKWYGHRPDRYEAFRERYLAELEERTEAVRELLWRTAGKKLTLLTATKDVDRSNAQVLAGRLQQERKQDRGRR